MQFEYLGTLSHGAEGFIRVTLPPAQTLSPYPAMCLSWVRGRAGEDGLGFGDPQVVKLLGFPLAAPDCPPRGEEISGWTGGGEEPKNGALFLASGRFEMSFHLSIVPSVVGDLFGWAYVDAPTAGDDESDGDIFL